MFWHHRPRLGRGHTERRDLRRVRQLQYFRNQLDQSRLHGRSVPGNVHDRALVLGCKRCQGRGMLGPLLLPMRNPVVPKHINVARRIDRQSWRGFQQPRQSRLPWLQGLQQLQCLRSLAARPPPRRPGRQQGRTGSTPSLGSSPSMCRSASRPGQACRSCRGKSPASTGR